MKKFLLFSGLSILPSFCLGGFTTDNLKATSTMMLPNSSTPPSTDCDSEAERGRIYVDTNATTGQQLYGCEGTGGWVLQGDGGGGGSGDVTDVNAGYGILVTNPTGPAPTVNLAPGATGYIQNRETLQSGATFYVSSGTVSTFTVTTLLTIPNSSVSNADAFGEVHMDTDAWATNRGAMELYDGTVKTFVVATVSTDTPTNGEVPRWNTGGQIDWATVSTSSPASNPCVKYYDLEASDGDINGQICLQCTDTGSGTEDCDIYLDQQINGVLTRTMLWDADDVITSSRTISTPRLRLTDSDGSNYAEFRSSAAMAGNIDFVLPQSTFAATVAGNMEIASISGTTVVLEFGTDGGGGGGGYALEPATVTITASKGMAITTMTFTGGYYKGFDTYSAGAGLCQNTNGCTSITQYQTSTSSMNYVAAVFPDGSTTYWDITVPLPFNYADAATFTYFITWTSTVSTGDVQWNVQARAVRDGVAIDGTPGTIVTVTDTATGNETFQKTTESAAMTASGSPVGGDFLQLVVYRGGQAAADTMTADARFTRIQITYNKDNITPRD